MVLTTSIGGRRVAPEPMSAYRGMPSASAAARSTLARSPVLWAPAEWTASAATAAIANVRGIDAFIGLVMLFGDRVRQIPLAARQRFRQHGVGPGIEERDPRSRGPGFQQHVRIFDGRRPREGVSIPMEALDHVHVFAMEIAADLVEPGVAVEAPRIDHQR